MLPEMLADIQSRCTQLETSKSTRPCTEGFSIHRLSRAVLCSCHGFGTPNAGCCFSSKRQAPQGHKPILTIPQVHACEAALYYTHVQKSCDLGAGLNHQLNDMVLNALSIQHDTFKRPNELETASLSNRRSVGNTWCSEQAYSQSISIPRCQHSAYYWCQESRSKTIRGEQTISPEGAAKLVCVLALHLAAQVFMWQPFQCQVLGSRHWAACKAQCRKPPNARA